MAGPHDEQFALWGRIAASFDATRRRPWPHVAAFLRQCAPGRILDAMAGNGRHHDVARTAGHDVILADWSRTLLAASATRHAADHVVADAADLPFATASFDAAIVVAGLPSLATPEARDAAWHELWRVLRPQAPLQVTVWSRHAPRFAGAGPDVLVPWRRDGVEAARPYHLYTPASLAAAAKAAGFTPGPVEAVSIAEPDDNLVMVAVR